MDFRRRGADKLLLSAMVLGHQPCGPLPTTESRSGSLFNSPSAMQRRFGQVEPIGKRETGRS